MFQRLKENTASFLGDRSGATAIEYGLIAGLIMLAIVVSMESVSTNTNAMYKKINVAVENATS